VPELKVESEFQENDEFAVSLQSMQGYRAEMEDAHTIMLDIPQLPGWSFFGVFDGHAGNLCSKVVCTKLPEIMFKNEAFVAAAKQAEAAEPDNSYSLKLKNRAVSKSKGSENADISLNNGDEQSASSQQNSLTECIQKAWIEFDRQFREDNPFDKSGSTGTCILISPKTYYFINLGDSRTILCGDSGPSNVVFETIDHKPSDTEERARIRASGATVSGGRINSLLAVSRAFGDFDYKDATVAPEDQTVCVIPSISAVPRDVNHTGIICACDGVWDMFSSKDVGLFTQYFWRATQSVSEPSRRLLFSSLELGSKDNISVIGIQFKHRERDLYDPQSDEAQYLAEAKQHIERQMDLFARNYQKFTKYDSVNRQKFVVKEGLRINFEFNREYLYSDPYPAAAASSQQTSPDQAKGEDASQQTDKKMETKSDFIAKSAIYNKHKGDASGSYFCHVGLTTFFEEIQQRAEKLVEDSVCAEMATREGSSTASPDPLQQS